jgi:hypothetical protein
VPAARAYPTYGLRNLAVDGSVGGICGLDELLQLIVAETVRLLEELPQARTCELQRIDTVFELLEFADRHLFPGGGRRLDDDGIAVEAGMVAEKVAEHAEVTV